MDLSVIIISYNVRYLLDACIESVLATKANLKLEIIVVDNHSADGSAGMIKEKYPQITLQENKENLGFAKANNQALRVAKGKICLLLNPDTVVPKATLIKAVDYLSSNPLIGAIGVKMIDGHSNYLPESKRGLPGLWASITKMLGIYRLFPKSRFWNKYYLGDLDENQDHVIEVLSGAFFMIKKEVMDKIGYLDEAFFMYGEDIDYSYRIQKAGWQLAYLGQSQIIHFKGRSSASDSWTYVHRFYQAMLIFIKKYYTSFSPISIFLHISVILAGLLSFIKKNINKHLLIFIDILSIAVIIYSVQSIWAIYYFNQAFYFYNKIFLFNAASCLFIWMSSLYLHGAYDRQTFKLSNLVLKSIFWGNLFLLMLYAVLPEYLRSSRAVLLISALLVLFILPWIRFVFDTPKRSKRGLIMGQKDLLDDHLFEFIKLTQKSEFSFLAPFSALTPEYFKPHLSDISTLNEMVKKLNISHLILLDKSESLASVFNYALFFKNRLHYLILSEASDLDDPLSQVEINIIKPASRRWKWIVNTLACFLLLPWIWLWPKHRKNFKDLLTGQKIWVSYIPIPNNYLPPLKSGVFNPNKYFNYLLENDQINHKINCRYALEYHPWIDAQIIFQNIFQSKF